MKISSCKADTPEEILQVLKEVRAPAAAGESELHALIAQKLSENGIEFVHEAKIGSGKRADFLIGSVVLEIKKSKPVRSTLLGQVTRYLSEEGVCAAIVVMQTRVPLPARICGKPVFTLPLNRLWGIALG